MNKVYACIDGLDTTTAVIDWAAWSARRLGVPLELLHVLERDPDAAAVTDFSGAIGLGAQEALLGQLSDLDARRGKLAQEAGRQMLASAGLQNVRMVGSASLSTTVRMVQAGMGVGVFSPAVLRRELAEGQLRMLEVDGAPLPDLAFTASWRRGRDSHVAAAVARLAVQVAASSGTDSKF